MKVTIKRNGIVTNGPLRFDTEKEAHEWIKEETAEGSFGKEAWSEEVEVTPAVFDENGVEISPAVTQTVNHPAEFTYEITDTTLEDEKLKQEMINQEHLKYLRETDYYIIREYETGVPAPTDIKRLRNEARVKVIK